MTDLKRQAERIGLQVGKKIKVECVKREQWSTTKTKIMVIGEIIALYPHIFVAEMQGKREKIKESFTYSQVVTKEVKVCKGKGWQRNRGLNTGIRETAKELHIKECMNDKTKWKGLQLLITPKGKETFKLLYLAAM